MRRAFSLLIAAVLTLTVFCAPVPAENQPLSMQYVPRTQRGTLFYLDINSETPIGAAMFELRFDPSVAEYRSVYCDDGNGEVMANPDGGTVKIVYSHRSGGKGTLYRVAFKALGAGDIRFALHVSQAAGADLGDLVRLSDCTLDVKLGSEDVAVSSGSGKQSTGKSSKSSGASKSSGKSYGGSRSEKSQTYADADDDEIDRSVFRDFSSDSGLKWALLGGGTVIVAGLLVALGVLIGKRQKKRRAETEEKAPPESDTGGENREDNSDEEL